MNLQIIDVSALPEPPKPRKKQRKAPARPQRETRTPDLFCIAPGAYLPSQFPAHDSPDYPAAVRRYIYAQTSTLIEAQTADRLPVPDELMDEFHTLQRTKGRSLFTPDLLSDADLRRYVQIMAPYALAPSSSVTIKPQSPAIAEYLLGGMPRTKIEELTERVMDVCEFPQMRVDPTFSDAICMTGFGPHADYSHHDGVHASLTEFMPGEEIKVYLARMAESTPKPEYARKGRMSARQDYLTQGLPKGAAFCDYLFTRGAYHDTLFRRVSRAKWEVCKQTTLLFSEHSTEMVGKARSRLRDGRASEYEQKVRVSDAKFARAVERVFNHSWADLELMGTMDHLEDDVERVMARLLIKKLVGGSDRANKELPKMSARCLLGIALLTAIPVMNMVRFAMEEFCRRGETFLDRKTLDDLEILITESELGMVNYTASAEMQRYRVLLDEWHKNDAVIPVSHFAHKLRYAPSIMWNRNGAYHYRFTKYVETDAGTNQVDVYQPKLDFKLAGLRREWPFEVKG